MQDEVRDKLSFTSDKSPHDFRGIFPRPSRKIRLLQDVVPSLGKVASEPMSIALLSFDEWQHIPLGMYSYDHPDHPANEAEAEADSASTVSATQRG